MARNASISLGQHFDQFVDELVASGRFASASEVVRAGLRKLEEEREQWLKDNAKAIEAYNEKVESSGTFSDSVRKF